MIRRRAGEAGIRTEISCHTFRATGITDYLQNGGRLEVAQQMANHESDRTTGLYDRGNDQISLDEVEGIRNRGGEQKRYLSYGKPRENAPTGFLVRRFSGFWARIEARRPFRALR
jgi:hypothetical protein